MKKFKSSYRGNFSLEMKKSFTFNLLEVEHEVHPYNCLILNQLKASLENYHDNKFILNLLKGGYII